MVDDKVDQLPVDDDVLHPLEDLEPVGRRRLPVSVSDSPDHLEEVSDKKNGTANLYAGNT
jgi:hypothetical protein